MAIRRLMMMGLTNYIRSLIKTFETQVNSNQGQFEKKRDRNPRKPTSFSALFF
jgi:hypothetical protein